MITYSIIQKSQLGHTNRIDAEYYQPIFLDLENNLHKFRSDLLEKVALVNGGKRLPVEETFSDLGVPYVRIVDIYNTFIEIDDVELISEDLHELLKQYQIKFKDILITIVGNTVGLVGYNQLNLDRLNFTENCARIRTTALLPEYLLVVLLSQVGQLQVQREKVGTAQPKLSLDRLRKFLIPVSNNNFQITIKGYVGKALSCTEQSKLLYKQAEELLLEELGLRNIVFEEELSYVVNSSDVFANNRVDPEYFQPKYQKLIEKIKSQNTKTLGELVSIKKGFEPGSEAYQEEGKLFIRVSSVSKLGIEEADQKYLSEDLYQKLKKDFEPKLGDILLTKDATPGIAYVIKEPLEGIISGGILDLKVKDNIESEYLALCISSIVGQWQAQRDAGGSIIAHWKPEQVKNLIIPILPNDTQEKIAELVRKSHEARKKSKELLDQAKRRVEEMIEKTAN